MIKNKTNRRILYLLTGMGLMLSNLFFTFFQPGHVYGKIFPNVDYVNWNYDANHNRIDDRLEGKDSHEMVDAVILFNRCLTLDDIQFVQTHTTIDYIGQYVQGIWVKDVPLYGLIWLLSTPHGDSFIFRIEQCDSVYAVLDVSCPAVKARQSATYSPNTAWDKGYKGQGVVIGILDTGVDDGHPAFAGKYVAGYNAITRLAVNPDDDYTVNNTFHGTHVAGIALGVDPNGTYIGVARDANLVDVKVLGGNGGGTQTDVVAGIEWCITNRQTYNIKVLNLSLSDGSSCNGKCALCMAVDKAVDAGLVVCVAAGNDYGTGWMPSPAAGGSSNHLRRSG